MQALIQDTPETLSVIEKAMRYALDTINLDDWLNNGNDGTVGEDNNELILERAVNNFIKDNTPIPTVTQLIESRTMLLSTSNLVGSISALKVADVEDIFLRVAKGEVINDLAE